MRSCSTAGCWLHTRSRATAAMAVRVCGDKWRRMVQRQLPADGPPRGDLEPAGALPMNGSISAPAAVSLSGSSRRSRARRAAGAPTPPSADRGSASRGGRAASLYRRPRAAPRRLLILSEIGRRPRALRGRVRLRRSGTSHPTPAHGEVAEEGASVCGSVCGCVCGCVCVRVCVRACVCVLKLPVDANMSPIATTASIEL